MSGRTRSYWLIRFLLLPIASVVVLFTLVLGVLAFTESGTRWLVANAVTLVPGELSTGSVSGTFGGSLELEQLRYSDEFGEVRIARIVLVWSPSKLFSAHLQVDELSIDTVEVMLRELEPVEPDPNAEPTALALPSLPLSVDMARLSLSDFSLLQPGSTTPLVVQRVAMMAGYENGVWRVDSLDVALEQHDTQVNAHLLGQATTALPMKINAQGKVGVTTPGIPAVEVDLTAVGTTQILQVDVHTNAPYNVRVEGQLQSLDSAPELTLDAYLDGFKPDEVIATVPISDISGKFGLVGSLSNQVGELSLRADTEFGEAELSGSVRNGGNTIQLAELILSMPESGLSLQADGQVGVVDGLLDIAVKWQRLGWPLAARTDYAVGRSADRSADSSVKVSSETGSIALSGSLDNFSLTSAGQLKVGADSEEAGHFQINGEGSLTHLSLSQFDLHILQGMLTGEVAVNWQDFVQSTFNLQARGINPHALASDWPGRLNLDVSGELRGAGSDNPMFSVSLGGDGELRKLPVEVAFEGAYKEQALSIQAAHLSSGNAVLSVAGELSNNSLLDWQVDARDLGDLLPTAAGSVVGTGSLRGPQTKPDVVFDLQGSSLRYDEYSIEQLTLEASVGELGHAHSTASVDLVEGNVSDVLFKNGQINISGSRLQHDVDLALDLSISSMPIMSRIIMGGVLAADDSYQFVLSDTELSLGDQPELTLDAPVEGLISEQGVVLAQTCLNSSATEVCLAADTTQESAPLAIGLQRLPLALLQPMLPTGTWTQGTVSGHASLEHWQQLEALTGDAELSIQGAGLFYEPESETSSDPVMLLSFAPGSVTFKAAPQKKQIDISLPLLDGGNVAGSEGDDSKVDSSGIDINGIAGLIQLSGTQQHLEGRVSVNLPNLNFLEPFITAVAPVSMEQGALAAQLRLDGTLASPRARGEVRLLDGHLAVPDLNSNFEALELSIIATEHGDVLISGQAASGEGQISLRGEIADAYAAPTAAVVINGNNFQIADTNEAVVRISPELQITASAEHIDLKGNVVVPTAQIVLNKLPISAQSVSADQIIIEADGSTTSSSAGPAINAEIGLVLGDAVSFEGQGLTATFTGDLNIKETPGEPTTASGQIVVKEGTYQSYGQDLSIEDGKLIWVGGPLSEPGMDILATRTPRPDITVGIRARGALSQPEISLTSRPAMPESDQLSYLVLGRPIEDNSSAESSYLNKAALALGIRGGTYLTEKYGSQLGFDQIGIETEPGEDVDQAALVVGKYLTPRLYVSYGLGLLESVSTFKMEYLLSKRWRLTTESSAEQSGGDVVFTVEQD